MVRAPETRLEAKKDEDEDESERERERECRESISNRTEQPLLKVD